MEKEIIIGVVGLIGVFILYKFLSDSSAHVEDAQEEGEQFTDVLNDKKYKVKGQWDR